MKVQSEDQLINLLMEETFSDNKSSKGESGDLLSYFNHKNLKQKINNSSPIEDLFKRRQVIYAKACTQNQGLFRFKLNKENLDIPSNWSLFEGLTSNKTNMLIRSSCLHDDDLLFDVLNKFLGGPEEIGIVKYEGLVYLIHTKAGSSQDLEWLESFILSESEIPRAA